MPAFLPEKKLAWINPRHSYLFIGRNLFLCIDFPIVDQPEDFNGLFLDNAQGLCLRSS